MGRPGTFQPGQSGNPAGRPRKNRALTDILERAGSRTVQVGEKRVARKTLAAEMVWDAIATGRMTMADGKSVQLEPQEIIGLVKWVYQHIDGPPKGELDVTSGDKPITFTLQLDNPSGFGDEE